MYNQIITEPQSYRIPEFQPRWLRNSINVEGTDGITWPVVEFILLGERLCKQKVTARLGETEKGNFKHQRWQCQGDCAVWGVGIPACPPIRYFGWEGCIGLSKLSTLDIWIIKITPVVRILSTSKNYLIHWIPSYFFCKEKICWTGWYKCLIPVTFWFFLKLHKLRFLIFFSLMSFVKMTYPWKIHANKTMAGFLTCSAETLSLVCWGLCKCIITNESYCFHLQYEAALLHLTYDHCNITLKN